MKNELKLQFNDLGRRLAALCRVCGATDPDRIAEVLMEVGFSDEILEWNRPPGQIA